jgi:hypothetical protein
MPSFYTRSLHLVVLFCVALLCLVSSMQAATINVPAGGNMQNAINAAVGGDIIVVQAGATYARITLPVKAGNSFITIQSSQTANLPVGKRVFPADAPKLARITTAGSNVSAVQTVGAAHHYKFIGIEFTTDTNANLTALVSLGTTGAAQDTVAEIPQFFIFDRCYFHDFSETQTLRRALAMNSGNTDVLNCYFSGFKDVQDAQAIGCWNGPGPYKIINNYLEASGENIMFGGATPSVPNLIPSDIEIRRNHFKKPIEWRDDLPVDWTEKNLFEIKFARRVLIDGNIFEQTWSDGQAVAIVIKVDSNSTSMPWVATEDVTFTNNIVRSAPMGVTFQGRDYAAGYGFMRGVKIINNLFYDIDGPKWGGSGWFLLVTNNPNEVTIDHNTAIQTSSTIASSGTNNNWIYRNNLAAHNTYGVKGDGLGTGDSTLNGNFPGIIFTKNVLMGGPSSLYSQHPGNFFPPNWGTVQFLNQAGNNYRLAATSPYKNAGTDGKDIGANIDQIDAATAGVIAGTPPAPTTSIVTVFAEADTYVRGGTSANTNFGTQGLLEVKLDPQDANQQRETYIRFDTRNTPNIVTVRLRLFGKLSTTGVTNVPIAVYGGGSTAWTETGLTYANKFASLGQLGPTKTILDTMERWYEYDVTTYVKQEKAAGRGLVTFVFKHTGTSGAAVTQFRSRQATSNQPRLLVTVQ